jgi:hypothetical protein
LFKFINNEHENGKYWRKTIDNFFENLWKVSGKECTAMYKVKSNTIFHVTVHRSKERRNLQETLHCRKRDAMDALPAYYTVICQGSNSFLLFYFVQSPTLKEVN